MPNGLVHASTIAEARRYARERPPGSSALELWRVSAAAVGGLIDNRAAAETQALLRSALEHDALAAEPGSLLASLATLHLIIDGRADDRVRAVRGARRRRPPSWLADRARPRLHVPRDGPDPGRRDTRRRGGRPARLRVQAAGGAAGAWPRRSALSGPGALTPAEHRVAELAARGHGNRAIAERLYVTPRTVETHLTHAFAKLDIRSRAELAAALQPAPADSGTLTVT